MYPIRKLLTILFLTTVFTSQAQYPNGGENSYYIFGEKDSVIYPMTAILKVFDDGSTFLYPYGKTPFLKGNNYNFHYKNIFDKLVNGVHSIALIDTNLIYYNNNGVAYAISQKNIIDSIKTPKFESICLSFKGRIYFCEFDNTTKKIVLKQKSGNKVITLGPPPFEAKTQYGGYCFFVINGKECIGNLNDFCYLEDGKFGEVFSRKNKTKHQFVIQNLVSDRYLYTTNITYDSLFRTSKKNLNSEPMFVDIGIGFHPSSLKNSIITNKQNNHSVSFLKDDSIQLKLCFDYQDRIHDALQASNGSYYINTTNKLLRGFEYIKRYPRIFNGSNSSVIFSITQAQNGNIWAGSYNGGIAEITNHKTNYFPLPQLRVTNGATTIGNKQIFISESATCGIYSVDERGYYKRVFDKTSGFIFYKDTTEQTLYYGSYENGLYFTTFNNIEKGNDAWKNIGKEQGLTLKNILTITKDKLGRIWMGRSNQGWAIYYPKTNKAKTYLIEKNETNFGTMSSCTDTKGTVWLGTKQQGLLYYNDYSTDTVNPALIKKINHPLLPNGKTITSMVQHGNWLIMGVTNYYVAFDLATWYAAGKVLVKYLNPQEANFTAETEQNTALVDKRDSSVWFSTNDMLYQWDFKRWLNLPTYTVSPIVNISYNTIDSSLAANDSYYLEPTNNTIKLQVWFQTKDNMPRYFATAFGKVGDSLSYENVSLNTYFTFSNLASGSYVFKLLICQSDGSVSYYNYYITVNKFWWQKWWVWLLASLVVFFPIFLWLNAKRKTAVQNKQLKQLQLISLSNQFKPHFTINALNSIGSAISHNPTAEQVLDKLSNATRIVFDQTKKQSIAHSLQNEWEIIENIVAITKLMYINELEFKHNKLEFENAIATLQVPMGLLQIFVENALHHGLENKTTAPWIVEIIFNETKNYLHINIIDNGIGRKKADGILYKNSNGVGIKNILEMVKILNTNNSFKINIDIVDDVFTNNNNLDTIPFEGSGTKVEITIPKQFKYL